jgi:hypothetical protein
MPNYYDSMFDQLLYQSMYPQGETYEEDGETRQYAAQDLSPEDRRDLKRQASGAETDMMRSLMGGSGGGQPNGRYDYFRDYKDARASMGPSMEFRKRSMMFDKPPSEAMMAWNPYNPERWDDYGDQTNPMIKKWENMLNTRKMKQHGVYGYGR